MKWLLVLLVVLAGVWWLRKTGRGTRGTASSPSSSTATDTVAPQTMTQCLQCGVHLPRQDAIQGRLGHYCSPAHRQQHEG